MRQLVYLSSAIEQFTILELHEILSKSRYNNQRSNITGLLLFDGHDFLQVLEGNRQDIGFTLERINRDSRHRSISILSDRDVPCREFGDWAMAANDQEGGAFGKKVKDLLNGVTCPMLKVKFSNFVDYA